MMVRWQRVLIYILGGIGCWLLLVVWSQGQLREVHLQIMLKGLEHHARLTELLFHLDDSISNSEIDNIRQKIPYHIAVIDRQGRVVADSLFGQNLEHMDNQINQREIIQAVQEGLGSDLRYNPATDGWFLYAAVALSTGQGFIRLSQPVSGPWPTP